VASVPELLERLGAGDPDVRAQVCLEIGQRFQTSASAEREAIIRSLNTILGTDPEQQRRADAALCAGVVAQLEPTPDERERMAQGLHRTIATDHDPTVVLFAVRALPDFDQRDQAIEALTAVLSNQTLLKDDREGHLRMEVFLALGRLGARAIPTLMNWLHTYPEAVMIALSVTGTPQAFRILEEQARSADPHWRSYAVQALGLLGLTDPPQAMREEIKQRLRWRHVDSDPDVRRHAAAALEAIHNTEQDEQ
jgi:hypothetical protein